MVREWPLGIPVARYAGSTPVGSINERNITMKCRSCSFEPRGCRCSGKCESCQQHLKATQVAAIQKRCSDLLIGVNAAATTVAAPVAFRSAIEIAFSFEDFTQQWQDWSGDLNALAIWLWDKGIRA